MSAAFTPGPWEFERGEDSKPRPWVGRLKDNAYSALACGETHEESMANARLIAAAPELYEALAEAREAIGSLDEDALGSFVDPNTGEPIYPLRDELLDTIEAALAKARGEHD